MRRLALKVDVDTLVGFKEGVPALLRVLGARGVPASFFVAMGPDHSGRAIRRLFTHKGFLQKMLRTGAPRLYGLKTMLYGTLLPGPPIAASAPELLLRITAAGHELGLHGYDHVLWQDRLPGMTRSAGTGGNSPGPEGFWGNLGVSGHLLRRPGLAVYCCGSGRLGGRPLLLHQ